MKTAHPTSSRTKSARPRRKPAAGGDFCHAGAVTRVFPVLIESEPGLQVLVLTRFLDANRGPLRSKTLSRARVFLANRGCARYQVRAFSALPGRPRLVRRNSSVGR